MTSTAAVPAPSTSPDPPVNAVEIDGLSKTYRGRRNGAGVRALDSVSLDVPRGSFFGLLGPNGAGKSTLINILAGLVVKTGGTARVWGRDIDREARLAKLAIGVVPQEINIDAFFSPRELLDLQAGMYGVPRRERRTEAILRDLHLTDKADAYMRSLSGGMKRRLMVGKAMVHAPPVLILDEPTAGVDVELRRELWRHMRALNRRGVTILLTTHYLEEAEELCDRIAIIDHGKVIACDRTENLLRLFDRKTLCVHTETPLAAVPAELERLEASLDADRRLCIPYRPSRDSVADILAALHRAGVTIRDLTTEEADLEDIFLRLTKARSDDSDG